MMPATNSCTTELSDMTPYRIIGIEGGMITARVAEEEVTAAAKGRGIARFFIGRDQDGAGRRHVGHGGPGDLGKEHGRRYSPSPGRRAHEAQQRRGEGDQTLGDARGIHDRAGQNEHGDGQQRKLGGAVEHDQCDVGQDCRGPVVSTMATTATTPKRNRDGHVDQDQSRTSPAIMRTASRAGHPLGLGGLEFVSGTYRPGPERQ